MTGIEILLTSLGLAGGAMNTAGNLGTMKKAADLSSNVENIEKHIQLIEYTGIGVTVAGLLSTMLQCKTIADHNRALQTKADKIDVEKLANEINAIKAIKADKTSVDSIQANVGMLTSMINRR